MKRLPLTLFIGMVFMFSGIVSVHAASATAEMYEATPDGAGNKLGEVNIEETEYGLVFTPVLANLPSGGHGFHVHTQGDCGPASDPKTNNPVPAGAAGGHYDPADTKRHSTPWDNNGHLGDLPLLFVDSGGNAQTPVLAPRIKSIETIRGLALMVHAGGDNHADHPMPLGGGGARVVCGIIR